MSCIPELPYLLALKMCARRFLVLNNSRALLITSSVRRVDPGSNIAHIAVRRSASLLSVGQTHFHADVQRFSCADDGHLLHMTAQCIKETMILKSYQSIFRSLHLLGRTSLPLSLPVARHIWPSRSLFVCFDCLLESAFIRVNFSIRPAKCSSTLAEETICRKFISSLLTLM